MKYYKSTFYYEGKKISDLDNKIGPLFRRHKGRITESKYDYTNNRTVVIGSFPTMGDWKNCYKEYYVDHKYLFLKFENVVCITGESE